MMHDLLAQRTGGKRILTYWSQPTMQSSTFVQEPKSSEPLKTVVPKALVESLPEHLFRHCDSRCSGSAESSNRPIDESLPRYTARSRYESSLAIGRRYQRLRAVHASNRSDGPASGPIRLRHWEIVAVDRRVTAAMAHAGPCVLSRVTPSTGVTLGRSSWPTVG